MTFVIENTHLGITEEDIKTCNDVEELKVWDEEITKQVIVMDSKLRGLETKEMFTAEDKKTQGKTIHARKLQGLLIKMIENRLETIRAERKNSMEALYFTYAEQDLPGETHMDIMNKVERAIKGDL